MKSATEWSKLHGEIGLDREDIGIREQWIRAIQADALRHAAGHAKFGLPSSAMGILIEDEAEALERGTCKSLSTAEPILEFIEERGHLWQLQPISQARSAALGELEMLRAKVRNLQRLESLAQKANEPQDRHERLVEMDERMDGDPAIEFHGKQPQ